MILALSTLMNSFYVFALLINWIYNLFVTKENTYYIDNENDMNMAIFVPCYNETIDELNLTFDSIYNQKNLSNKKILYTICDGNNETSKNVIQIFKPYISESYKVLNAYKTWDDIFEPLYLYTGYRNNFGFIIMVKENNKGKRDSLAIIRRILHYYNKRTEYDIDTQCNIENYFGKSFLNLFIAKTNKFLMKSTDNINSIKKLIRSEDEISINSDSSIIDYCIEHIDNTILDIDYKDENNKIDYIYGTDADTELDEMCIYNLLKDMIKADSETVASVGFVDLYMKDTFINPLKLYQFGEYYSAQLLRRHFQSTITKKVNCLSGCNQLIKICKETCGDEILNLFNKKPDKDSNIYKQILATASEDRNHVTLMFQLTPYIKTIQTLNAKVYTKVPLNIKDFLSQRKRWNLGTITNDSLILCNSNHKIIERFQAFVNIFINSLNTFVFISTINFVISIIKKPDWLMLYLSTIIFIPILYHLLTPFTKYRNTLKRTIYYYISYIFYILCGPVVNLTLHLYTLFKLDDFNWNIYKK
jgi:chitin synthase